MRYAAFPPERLCSVAVRHGPAYAPWRLGRLATCLLCFCGLVGWIQGAGSEQDQYEEQTLQRYAERWHKQRSSPRLRWYRELQALFPGKVIQPQKEEDFQQWFELLAEGAEQWQRPQNPSLAELFDQVRQRLELGPVPSLRQEEFLRYARRVLWRESGGNEELPMAESEADKVFRVLDQDGDGLLEVAEMTTTLRLQRSRVDLDGNGRVDRSEYRRYFIQRATLAADALAANKPQPASSSQRPAAIQNALPAWFHELDRDQDGQIALHEWVKSGRPLEQFQQLDADGDYLLTAAEYFRLVRQQDKSSVQEGLPLPLTGGIKKEQSRNARDELPTPPAPRR